MIDDPLDIFSQNFKNYLITTTSRRSKIAPKKPTMVIIVSVFISGLCTGHALSRSRIYRFPEMRGF